VGRAYAGILGPLALATVLVRGLRQGAAMELTLLAATIALCAFAVLGFILGIVAEWTVEDSVRSKIAAEVAAHEAAHPGATKAT
jgi:hypothetical protein